MGSKNISPYYVLPALGIFERVLIRQRRLMVERFLELCIDHDDRTIVDVGVTIETGHPSANFLEAWYPRKDRITAVGMDDASFLERAYPGLKFVRGNGLDLPLEDRSFDVAYSSAVIEHVGSRKNQVTFVRELARVSRRCFFITTPNRWFPLETHTSLPLIHWLPSRAFRGMMRRIGHDFYSKESNLNLLGLRDLLGMSSAVPEFSCKVVSVSLLGWPSNLLLVGHRRAGIAG